MIKKRYILVTGSEGFIGRHLVKALKSRGASIYRVDKRIGIDVSKSSFVKKFANKKIGIIFHLGMLIRLPKNGNNEDIIYENNIKGMINILKLCRLTGAKLVFISSYVYGKPEYLPIDELHPVKPHNVYAKSKLESEALCRVYHDSFGVKVVILRPFNVYGPGQSGDFVIPAILKKIRHSNSINLNGKNDKRDFLYIDDMIRACIRAGLYNKNGFDVFNIGSGKSYSINEILSMLGKQKGAKIKASYCNSSPNRGVSDTRADIRKAKQFLKWHPRISIEKGLSKILKHTSNCHYRA